MQLSYLLCLGLSGAVMAYHRRHLSYTSGTVGTVGPTGTGGTAGYYPNITATATATTTSASPTYTAYEILKLPCPDQKVLTCCELAFDGRTSYSECISPFKVYDTTYDACPIPQKSGECCDIVNTDGTATECTIAEALFDYAPPGKLKRRQ